MDVPTGVLYTGVLMAVAGGLTAWRFAAAQVRVSHDTDRLLGICLVLSIAMFAAFLADSYLPGHHVP